MLAARLLREAVLQQSSLSANDAYCAPAKQRALLELVLAVYDRCLELVGARGERRERSRRSTSRRRPGRATSLPPDGADAVDRDRAADPRRGSRSSGERPRARRVPLGQLAARAAARRSRASPTSAGTSSSRSGSTRARCDTASCSTSTGSSRSSRSSRARAASRWTGARVSFAGSPMRIPVGEEWLGRVCNGRGEPLDGGPPVLGGDLREIGGSPINPAARATPGDPILTGVSVVDGLATLVRGQKLPIFSVGGLPHLELAAQIAAQATARGRALRGRVRGDGPDERRRGVGARAARGPGESPSISSCSSTPPTSRSSSGSRRRAWRSRWPSTSPSTSAVTSSS